MDAIYQINPELDIPIYRQLVDTIHAAVKKGILLPDQQLPTVSELSQRLGIARGTIKRAYDELERAGIVDKAQGRGTFVCYQPASSGSRKEQAMAAIDALLDNLEELGFSAAEVNIFLNLKLRERAEQESQVKIAVLECNPENLAQMTEQLHGIPRTDIYSYLVQTIEQYPYQLSEDIDLIVTTAAHAEFLEQALPDGKKIARVAICLTASCLSDIIKLRKGKRVGVLGYSRRFGELLCSTCKMYTDGVEVHGPEVFTPQLDMQNYLKDKDAVLVPRNYEKYCDATTAGYLDRFEGKLIECSYEMDAGSFLYLQEKTRRILEEKSIS